MNKMNVFFLVIVAVVMSFGAGYWVSNTKLPDQSAETPSQPAERTALFYRNPMNPAITSPVFMQDDMGMDHS